MSNFEILFTLFSLFIAALGLLSTILFKLLEREKENAGMLSEIRIRVQGLIESDRAIKDDFRAELNELKERVKRIEARYWRKGTIPPSNE